MVFANYLARHHVGCEPDLRAVFLRSPRRWLRVVASTMAPAQFRFRGPGASQPSPRMNSIGTARSTRLRARTSRPRSRWSRRRSGACRLVPRPRRRPALDERVGGKCV